MLRTDWEELSPGVRAAVEHRTGPVHAAHTVSAGKNSALATILATQRGSVFVKGLRTEDPRVVSQDREAVVSPYVRTLSRELLWRTEADGWSLLCFSAAPGRHADYSPGSSDVLKVAEVVGRLGQLPCPDLPQLKYAEQRWARYVDHPDDLALLSGQNLLHTDYNPDNVLVDGGSVRLIDWAWPTRGAGFIDPACLIVRLVYAGHTPESAEAAVAPLPAWGNAPKRGVDVFATALARMWTDIAEADPVPWKQRISEAARAWMTHRSKH
jgi:hypothetical protein